MKITPEEIAAKFKELNITPERGTFGLKFDGDVIEVDERRCGCAVTVLALGQPVFDHSPLASAEAYVESLGIDPTMLECGFDADDEDYDDYATTHPNLTGNESFKLGRAVALLVNPQG